MGVCVIRWVANSHGGYVLCPRAKHGLWRLAHRHSARFAGCFITAAVLASWWQIPEEEVKVHLRSRKSAGLIQPIVYPKSFPDQGSAYCGPTLNLFVFEDSEKPAKRAAK